MPRKILLSYVQDTFVKKQSRGWKFYCPVCGGNDCWYTPDNAFAYCFNCGSSFTVVDDKAGTDDTTGVDDHVEVTFPRCGKDCTADLRQCTVEPTDAYSLYSRVSDLYHKLLPDHARTYLHKRGLDDTAIHTFMLGYCPSTPFALYDSPLARLVGLITDQGKPTLQERITIPYTYKGVVYDIRGRLVESKHGAYISRPFATASSLLSVVTDTKYISLPKKYTPEVRYPYNVDGALTKAREYIIITEGEFKAIVADQYGFPCVALPGMSSYRVFPSDVLKYPHILVFDSQEGHDDQIDAAMASFVRKHPVKDVYVARLPLLGYQKMDIDTFLLHPQGGAKNFQTLLESAIPWKTYVRLRAL